MNKAKGKNNSSNTKNQPVNINISFNINPKSILHQQIPSQIKFPSTSLQDPMTSAAKNRIGKQKRSLGDNSKVDGGEKNIRRGQTEVLTDGEFDKKQVDKIKKKFLNRINNMDILLESPPAQNKLIVKQEQVNLSQIMSEKMPQYEALPNKKLTDPMQFTLNPKSKVIMGGQVSKILSIYPSKKTAKKMVPIQHKQSKILTHYKGYSTFTDVKCNSQRVNKKRASRSYSTEMKKNKPKQENLQQKLERFKLDMMKLSLLYDENEVLKTKLSSEYYNNIRSRQISKDTVDFGKINEVQKHEKIDEIKSFEAIQAEKKLALKGQTQSFKKIKDVYQQMEKKKQRLEEHKQCTENIIEYYKQITSQQKSNPLIHYHQHNSLSQKQDSLKSWKDDSVNKSEKNDNSISVKNSMQLKYFIKFLEQKMKDNSQLDEITIKIKKLLSQYESISKQDQQQQIINNVSNENIDCNKKQYQINEQIVPIGKIDDGINKQLELIPSLKDDLIQNHKMSGDLMFQLQIWQQNYKNQLLKIKGRMWKQYKNIKSIIEGRISNGLTNQRVIIETRTSKKQKRIMKCLSQKIMTRYQQNNTEQLETIQQLKQSRKEISQKSKQNSIIMKQEHLEVQRSLSDENSIIETDLQIAQSQPIFIPSSSDIIPSKQQISAREDNMLINSLIQIQMDSDKKYQQKLQRKNLSLSKQFKLTEQDKQDIFQFIFLDICIQLYQQALQSQLNPRSPEQIVAVQRILKSIQVYMCEQKRLKTQRNNRKIGISTSMSAVKETLHQINEFLQSELTIKGNPIKLKDRIINKLNIPLGPNQLQILKSLRLSIFDNQPVQDYGDDVEEGDLLVMQPDIFLHFQNQIIGIQKMNFPKYYQDEKRDQQRVNFLKNCTHIHHKAIFDCINENLDYHRLFGIWGKPFSWKKAAVFSRNITQKDLASILNRSSGQVMKSSAFVCGLMKDKQDSLVKDIATDDNYVRKLQDQRIYKLLEDFVFQMDQKWYFHDDQQSQILVQLSHIVWTILIKEMLRQFQKFQK